MKKTIPVILVVLASSFGFWKLTRHPITQKQPDQQPSVIKQGQTIIDREDGTWVTPKKTATVKQFTTSRGSSTALSTQFKTSEFLTDTEIDSFRIHELADQLSVLPLVQPIHGHWRLIICDYQDHECFDGVSLIWQNQSANLPWPPGVKEYFDKAGPVLGR